MFCFWFVNTWPFSFLFGWISCALRFTKRLAKFCWRPKPTTADVLRSGCKVALRMPWEGTGLMTRIKSHCFGLVWSKEPISTCVFKCFKLLFFNSNQGVPRVLMQLFLRTSLSRFLGLQEKEGRFLSDRRQEIFTAGMTLCKRYVDLAKHALRQGFAYMFCYFSCHVVSGLYLFRNSQIPNQTCNLENNIP